jgi:uncharacterized circularly permuted ATP-grasp superfamily protein/uncharacterized alpha-E superfamily protein
MAVGARSEGYLATYVADTRRYDELLDEKGAVRKHWRPLIERVAAGDGTGAGRRGLELTRRLIIENGVTYNVYADPQGADRPWGLDPLPLVLTADEWREIETGLAQRAEVLDSLLKDLYGPQKLLAEGVVPPELPFGHPNFLWPCHGIAPKGGKWLHVYAADLARAPDGRWWVLADRTQAPSGAGYALENREIVEQVLPDSIRDLGVRRVRGFFGNLRSQLLAGGAELDEAPLAVLLTPGPFNETYFEHAYLAGQLGLPLAEGSDLTVRGDTVYLKTLGGLRRVHAIFRRLDDDFCDPVELRSDSALGVPGLLGAVRAGRVVVANALGTGVLESAAWLGFLPGISERLTGESLKLPAVATWWCGEPPALDYVLRHLDELVIKPAYPNQRFEPVFGRDLARDARQLLIARLRTRPYAYVAQEHVALSQAPVWRQNGSMGLSARALAIRVYAVATDQGFRVMPGGLARVATDTAVDVVSAQRGGGSKDIWVLAERSTGEVPAAEAIPARPVEASLARPAEAGDSRPAEVSPAAVEEEPHAPPVLVRQDDIPSRVVENLFWLGRYAVRCEDKARLIRSTLAVRVDAMAWREAVKFCRALGFVAATLDPSESLRDDRNPLGIVADVKRLAWCASQVRSRLSGSYWRVVLDLQRQLQRASIARGEPREAVDRLILSLSALAGFAFDDMTHDEGWRLMRVGRRLERLQFLSNLLAQHLQSAKPARSNNVEWLLEACDSLVIYRSRYVSAPRLGPTLDLLIRDIQHPRALAFQSEAIGRDLATLATALGGQSVEGSLGQGVPFLDDTELFALEGDAPQAAQARANLAQRLRELALAAGQLSDRVSMRHFSHTGVDARALAT